MSSGAGWRVHDRQQGGRRSLKRYRRYRSSSAAVADLQPRKPHHDLVGRAGVCRQYRNLSLSVVWRLHLARRQHRRTRRYDLDQRYHAYAIACARRGWPGHRGLSVVFCVRLFVLAGARPFWPAPARSLLADLFHAVHVLAGLWFGRAFIVIGLGITVLTLLGYFDVPGGAFL